LINWYIHLFIEGLINPWMGLWSSDMHCHSCLSNLQ